LQDQILDMPNEVVSSSSYEPVNINDVHDEYLSFGDRLADSIARCIGSWTFILVQAIILILWFLLNSAAWFFHWDGYPFILCNLFMSAEAAFSAPIILMSQNRQAVKDRLTSVRDYQIDKKSEQDIRAILARLDQQDQLLEEKLDAVLTQLSTSKTTRSKTR
jgi:uncharacterized membrane protein